jgi:hypothetical protein
MADIDKLVAYIRKTLTGLNSPPSDAAYEYASVPLCVIDAVFSIGVRYESTERTVTEFCARYHWQRDGRGRVKERTISEFLSGCGSTIVIIRKAGAEGTFTTRH